MREARRWFASHFKVKTFDEFNVALSAWQRAKRVVPDGDVVLGDGRVVPHQRRAQPGAVLPEQPRVPVRLGTRARRRCPRVARWSASPIELKNLETVADAYIALVEPARRQAPTTRSRNACAGDAVISKMMSFDERRESVVADVLVTTDWVAQHANDAERSRRRSRCRHHGLRSGPRARRGRLELDDRALRHARPRHRADQEARRAARQERHRQQDDDRPLRRQQQLVRRVGVLAAEDLRPRGRAHHGRRPQEVARRRRAS